MKAPIVLEAFDRGDVRTVVHHRERQARDDPLPVHQNGARPAGALVETLLGAGQICPFPEHVQQRRPIVHRDLAGFAVDAYPHYRGRRGICRLVLAAASEQRGCRHYTADGYRRTDKSSPVEIDHSAERRRLGCEPTKHISNTYLRTWALPGVRDVLDPGADVKPVGPEVLAVSRRA